VAIRAGALADSTLIVRTLGSAPWHLVATPGYLKKRGRPRSPEDLKKHDACSSGSGRNPVELRWKTATFPCSSLCSRA